MRTFEELYKHMTEDHNLNISIGNFGILIDNLFTDVVAEDEYPTQIEIDDHLIDIVLTIEQGEFIDDEYIPGKQLVYYNTNWYDIQFC